MRLQTFYLLLTVLMFCFVFQSCDNNSTVTTSDEDSYVTQKYIDDLKNEKRDPSGVISFSRSEYQGMKLFMHHCNRCHPGGDKGKGPSLINKKNLPDFLIHFQIRKGLGDMPKFSKEKLPKENVKKIILFIHLLRENG